MSVCLYFLIKQELLKLKLDFDFSSFLILNNMGPNIDHRGTPNVIDKGSDSLSLFSRYFII